MEAGEGLASFLELTTMAKAPAFNAHAWEAENLRTAVDWIGRPKKGQYDKPSFQGTRPSESSRIGVWKQRGAYKSDRLFEIIGESAGRVYGFVLGTDSWVDGSDAHPVRAYGARGDTSGHWDSTLQVGYADKSELAATFPNIAAAVAFQKARVKLADVASRAEAAEHEAREANHAFEQKRRQLIEEATKRIDQELAAEKDHVDGLRRDASAKREASNCDLRNSLASLVEQQGGTAVDVSLIVR